MEGRCIQEILLFLEKNMKTEKWKIETVVVVCYLLTVEKSSQNLC